jgi:hypothetical protein
MKRSHLAVLATALLVAPAAAHAVTLYSNDFESGSTAGFTISNPTDTGILTAPGNGEKFLGQMTLGDTASLAVGTAGQTSVTLNFDLYTLNSLDGSTGAGPDYFDLNENGTNVLLHDTFGNAFAQTYGCNNGGGTCAGGTGSDPALTGVLGYEYYGPSHVYHMSYTVAVSGPTTVFNFIGNSNQGIGDEGFGIDNVVVTGAATSGTPEPASWALMLMGFGGLGAMMRSRRKSALIAA